MGDRIGYLILHYKTIKETTQCIASIEKLAEGTDYRIIVVDNGSGNCTGEELKEKYENCEQITVLISKENLGFARGNNLGFKYAKDELKCDFICMMNNDTELLQENFLELIKEEYEKSDCAVIGPKIILNHGKLQPLYKKKVDIETVEKDIAFMKKQLLYNKLHIRKFMRKLNVFLYEVRTGKRKKAENEATTKATEVKRAENVVLHGCCLIFTPKYIKQFDGLNDVTFMFREEEFLYLRLMENKLLSVYNPKIEIRHYEDAATNAVFTKESGKLKFQFENDIKSSKLLIKELEKLKNKA